MEAEDWIDEYEYDDSEPWLPSKDIVCMYCGKAGFQWGMSPSGWRLFDEKNRLHSCLPRPKTQPLSQITQRRSNMGLFVRTPVYISDRGDEYQVKEMESSHLLNAIHHHRKQIDVIDWILEQTGGPDAEKNQMLHLRRISLHTTVEALVTELRTRDPDKDHEHLQ